MERYTFTRHTNKSGSFAPETVTVWEYRYEELCFAEQREVHWRHLPTGPDVRYSAGPHSLNWRRIRN